MAEAKVCRDCGCPPKVVQRRILTSQPPVVNGDQNPFHARSYQTTYAQVKQVIDQSRREGYSVVNAANG